MTQINRVGRQTRRRFLQQSTVATAAIMTQGLSQTSQATAADYSRITTNDFLGPVEILVKIEDENVFTEGPAAAPDGSLLFTTENNYQQNRGIIGVYDATNLQRLGEFNSGGIGPHQLELMSDGKTLVAANGGIQTHPDKGREKLNISTMQSSLCYLDTHSGKMIDNFLPEDPQMSIRHLAVSSSDQVIAGVQYQGEKSALLPLVLSHRGETSLQPMQADELVWLGQNQYIASVAIDDAGKTAITTSPRGHSILIWNMENNQHQGTIPFSDVAGAVYSRQGNQFIVSNGSGQIISIHAETRKTSSLFTHSALRWDNHLTLWG